MGVDDCVVDAGARSEQKSRRFKEFSKIDIFMFHSNNLSGYSECIWTTMRHQARNVSLCSPTSKPFLFASSRGMWRFLTTLQINWAIFRLFFYSASTRLAFLSRHGLSFNQINRCVEQQIKWRFYWRGKSKLMFTLGLLRYRARRWQNQFHCHNLISLLSWQSKDDGDEKFVNINAFRARVSVPQIRRRCQQPRINWCIFYL